VSDTVIDNGRLLSPEFVDTDGNRVHAHGGGMLLHAGLFYWYGTSVKEGVSWLSRGVNLYTSPDLSRWTYRGMVLHNASITTATPGPYRIER